MALELNASKHRIYEYVESRMSFIAPNLSIIIGASTAAKIMGEARVVRSQGVGVGTLNLSLCAWRREPRGRPWVHCKRGGGRRQGWPRGCGRAEL